MKELALLIISRIADAILRRIFWLHGSCIAHQFGGWDGLKKYWHMVAYINDVKLNVVGQHLLDQRLSENKVFGSPLMTVSAANHKARLTNAGTKWEKRLNAIDKNHYAKAYESYKQLITKAYNELK